MPANAITLGLFQYCELELLLFVIIGLVLALVGAWLGSDGCVAVAGLHLAQGYVSWVAMGRAWGRLPRAETCDTYRNH